MTLPPQEYLEGKVAWELAAVHEALDGVQRVLERVGLLRLQEADPEALAAQEAALDEAYTQHLAVLASELERTRKWARQELKQRV